MNIAAIIVGIDGWEQYTKPLIESIKQHEPNVLITVIDNASATPYRTSFSGVSIKRTERLSYSAAINYAHNYMSWMHHVPPAEPERIAFDWYIVLSNDVLCTGPFAATLEEYGGGDLVGPCLKETHGFPYLEGWCVAVPRRAWVNWDERFLGSDWEDVAYSTNARKRGFGLVEDLPFKHLDQRQRYTIVEDFWGKDAHNRDLFMREYAQAVTA